MTLAILAARPVTRDSRLFNFMMLAMYSGQIGLFSSRDLLHFFLMWELELIPVYLLVSMWGGKKRLYSATKFILYTAGGKGRNARGIITVRHRGGGHKRLYRKIDFRRNEKDIYGRIVTIEYDPNRNAYICLIHYGDGEKIR